MNEISYSKKNDDIKCMHYKNWTKAYPPHFHAICNGKSAIVDINTAKAKGKLPKREKKFVEVWAEIHRQELLDNWDLMLKEHRVKDIAPLQ